MRTQAADSDLPTRATQMPAASGRNGQHRLGGDDWSIWVLGRAQEGPNRPLGDRSIVPRKVGPPRAWAGWCASGHCKTGWTGQLARL